MYGEDLYYCYPSTLHMGTLWIRCYMWADMIREKCGRKSLLLMNDSKYTFTCRHSFTEYSVKSRVIVLRTPFNNLTGAISNI